MAIVVVTGGVASLTSWKIKTDTYTDIMKLIPEHHQKFFENLQTSYETNEYFFVHAGVRPLVPLSKQNDIDMMWIRHDFLYSDYNWSKRIVHGHTITNEPAIKNNRIGIDTGCFATGILTTVKLPDLIFTDSGGPMNGKAK